MEKKNKEQQDSILFDRSKIYGNLFEEPAPENYSSPIPWEIQRCISSTNGRHYAKLIAKLNNYPEYELPIKAIQKPELMLDIGNGWGRWLVAGAKKGYTPIGIDLRLSYCKIARKTMRHFGINGYSIVADLENIPFKENIFEFVWSFSVIQHTHEQRMKNCLQHIERVLTNNGKAMLEFPNKNGIRNRLLHLPHPEEKQYNSWCVRYYSIKEYKKIITAFFSQFSFSNHSFLGIGVLKEDLKYVPFQQKILCTVSLLLSALTKVIPGMKYWSDSIYIHAKKKNPEKTNNTESIDSFMYLHHAFPGHNLNLIPLLRCPIYGDELVLSECGKKLISVNNRIYYPVIDDVPILIKSEACRY
jgi:ubiquinone/menaquinone biosynthesis C-methylase UbiE/uncharacterized protein YbaR (Trm112 family)